MAELSRSNKRRYKLDLHAVLYQEEGRWIAHCLEMDVMGDGATKAEALAQLTAAVELQVSCSVEHDNPSNIFQPADAKVFQMFFAGEGFEGAVEFEAPWQTDGVTIEGIESREFSGGLALC